jgi:hypothetical protein
MPQYVSSVGSGEQRFFFLQIKLEYVDVIVVDNEYVCIAGGDNFLH